MKASELRELQAPLKKRYRAAPEAALVTLRAQRRLGEEGLTCKVETGRALVEAGLHPGTGGDGRSACSGDMLLEALVACADVTCVRSPPRSTSTYGAARSAPKAISIFAAPSGFRETRRSASATFVCASISTPTRQPTKSKA